MLHHEEHSTTIESVLELLSEHRLGAMADAMQTLLNEAMKLERSEFFRASPSFCPKALGEGCTASASSVMLTDARRAVLAFRAM